MYFDILLLLFQKAYTMLSNTPIPLVGTDDISRVMYQYYRNQHIWAQVLCFPAIFANALILRHFSVLTFQHFLRINMIIVGHAV